ncbi:FG-GAP repeat protein [bacterium]|nr:FG-GAP repeat protein [bacterium]
MKLLLFLLIFTSALPAQEVIWDRSGDGNHAQFGYLIWAMGDQNNDGFDDWAVSANGEYNELPENEARFLLFHGGNPPETVPYMSFIRNPDVFLRYGGAAIGDVNGDGYIDWQLTLSFVSAPDSQIIHIFLGGPDADMNNDYVLDARPLDVWVQPLGDFNGDGHSDIYRYTPTIDRTDIFFGSANWDTIPDWVKHAQSPQNCLPILTNGDLNGDGFDDFITHGPDTPGGGIFFGSSVPDTIARQWNVSVPGGTMSADLNGDGRKDIVTLGTTQCHVFFGGDFIPEEEDATVNFLCTGGGTSAAESAGDFNGDGYDDVVVLSTSCNNGWGHFALYLGSTWVNPNPILQIAGRAPPLNLVGIFSAESLGDVNGDGLDDFAVGCVNTDNDGRRGRVVIFAGDTTYVVSIGRIGSPIPVAISLTLYPNPANSMVTLSISNPSPTGPLGVVVYNILGQRVDAFPIQASQQTRYSYNVSNLSSGQYVVQVYTANNMLSQKLVVLK